MKLSFYGATHEVTGSCFYLEACGKHIMIDCGMEQGVDQFENQEFPIVASEVDCVLLTHAHIDHSGELPLIYSKGFRGDVHTTSATYALCEIMLKDSAHIQEFEAQWKNRKAKRAGRERFVPAYTMRDAQGVLEQFKAYSYNEVVEIYDGIKVRFIDAGHLLGSASIELWVTENGVTKKIVFSGDIGNTNKPLIKNPQYIKEADYVVMESTYGDRTHGSRPDYESNLAKLIQKTFDDGGNIVIPSFAVGRTQEILYLIRKIKEKELVKGHGNFKVYVDSPLAIKATQIFSEKTKGYYDDEAMELIEKGINPISFPGLVTTETSDESKMINFDKRPKVIISASGMCEAGRIRHHLKHNLWCKECAIVFVGFQAPGTLGNILLNGAKKVSLFGEEIKVNASIIRFEGTSSHADRDGLIRWIQSFEKKPERVFVVHGQEGVCEAFAKTLENRYGYKTFAPYSGAQFDLLTNSLIKEGIIKRIIKKKTTGGQRQTKALERLRQAGARLLNIIELNKGLSNKELAKFADQVDSLCKKWDRK